MTVHWKSDRWLLILAVLTVCATSAGCRGTTPVFKDVPVQADPVEAQSQSDQRVLRRGDSIVIVLSLSGEPELLRVQEDGTLTLPSLGTTVAAGKTFAELRKELETKYPQLRRRHRHDDLIYEVRGEVQYPGPKPFALAGISLPQAIEVAGGFTKFANRNKVLIVRRDGRIEIVRLKVFPPDAPELRVFPGDSITVKRRGLFVRWP